MVFSPPPAVTPSLEFRILAEAEVEAAEAEYAAVADASDAEVEAASMGVGEAEAIEASSDPSMQEYYTNRERDMRESLADKTAQRKVMTKYLLAEQIFSHWSVVCSKEHQETMSKEAIIKIECWNSHYQK
jgi:hypothetical protein